MIFGKYRPLKLENKIYAHPLSQFCYGLWLNKGNINKTKQAIIFEGEKSVLKGEQLEYNNTVACCGSNISTYQVQLLLDCGAHELVIAFDRQWEEKNNDEYKHYIKNLEKLNDRYKNSLNVSIIYDRNMITGYKDAPIDINGDIFLKLFKERVRL